VVAEPTEVERRPYAELVAPSAPEAAESPGIWLQVAQPDVLLKLLPDSIQARPGVRAMADIGPAVSGIFGADVGAIIDLSQPFELATPIDAVGFHPVPVFAFRVRSPEAIEQGQAGLTLRRVAAGTWRLGDDAPAPLVPENDEPEEEEAAPDDEEGEMSEEPAPSVMPCWLAHAPPPVGYRVLCGEHAELVQSTASFLLRPQAPQTADIHVELAGSAYRRVIERALTAVEAEGKTEAESLPAGEKLGRQAGLAMVRTLVAHEQLRLDVHVGKQGIELQLDIDFPESPQTAGLQRWALDLGSKRVPASFGLLPGDSGVALSFVGLGKETTSSFLQLLQSALISDMAQEFVLSAKQVHELNEAFIGIVPADAHFSVAAGADVDAIDSVLHGDAVRGADAHWRPLTAGAIKDLQEALGGWVTIGLDVSPKEYLPAVERMLRANAMGMRRRPGMPKKDNEREDSHLKQRPLSVRGLPSGTLHVVDSVRPAKTYRPPLDGSEPPILPFDRHWLVVPEGQRVWIVGARSEALAGARALSVLRGGSRLAARSELQQLAERPLLAAVSFSPAGARLQSLDWDSVQERDLARLHFRFSGKMLHTATTPMLITVEAVPHQKASGFGLRAKLLLDEAVLASLIDMKMPSPP
jgi:hypothetical protein